MSNASAMLVPFLSGLAAALMVAVLFWPAARKSKFSARAHAIADETLEGDMDKRANPVAANEPQALRNEPKKVYRRIFEALHLGADAESSDIVVKLRMAGFQGEGPVITFLAVRALSPVASLCATALYVFTLRISQPFFVKLLIVLACGYVGWYLPSLFLSNKIQKRQEELRRVWPDALDLMLICVEAGMGIDSAVKKVSVEIGAQSVEMAKELEIFVAELRYLPERRDAYDNLARRIGIDSVKSATTTLVQAEKYGTQVGPTLRMLAQEGRDTRMGNAETKAAALPPKLTVPMILFFLPVLFAVIITPAIIQISKMK